MERLQQRQKIGFVTPLRYPGGKRKLFLFFRDLIAHNELIGCHYVEPFAGGAGPALSLLLSGYVKMIHLNDLDVAIYAFWKTVLEKTDELCDRIQKVSINIETWEHQRKILQNLSQYPEVEIAFATLFLNRTNRSGILRRGVIGGKHQTSQWKMDACFNKEVLIKRICRIATYNVRMRNN